jgi:DNA-binding transcriptional MerR regulator
MVATLRLTALAEEMTIDELARESGMTVRNVRAYQSRGLLPPPEVRARTGFYGPEHLARLKLVADMRGEGMNLRTIKKVLDGVPSAEGMLGFGQALLGAFTTEEPEVTTAEDLGERFGGLDASITRKAEKLGLIRPLGEDRYEVPSPTLLRAGEELLALGIPLEAALAVADNARRHTRSIAAAFVRLFTEQVLGTTDPKKQTPEDWARAEAALERLQPLAGDVVRVMFAQTMTNAVEREVEKILRGT